MVSSPDDEEAASSSSSLHILLVSNLPLGSIQTSCSVKSTDRLGPNMVLFRLAPGTATLFSADSAQSDVAFQVGQDNSNSILQLPEFLIWYPLPGIGGGAPQLLNKGPSGRGLRVYSTTRKEEEAGRGRRDSDGDGEHNVSSRSKLAAGESIAIETTATTAAEIMVPIHSNEKRRWRMGYYVVAPRYPRETIAKLLGGDQRQMSPLWFSFDQASGEPGETGGESDGEDVEMEEANGEEEEEGSSSTAQSPPPATRKSAREARARRRRRRRKRQLAEDDSNMVRRQRDAGKRAATANGTKTSKNRVADETEDEEESDSEPADTDDDDDKGRERSGLNHPSRPPGPDPGLMSLSAALPWAALAAAGGIRLEGRVDILPLGRPRRG
ncbi:hypothetical protein PG988_012039 [Apiospora saccharicola]